MEAVRVVLVVMVVEGVLDVEFVNVVLVVLIVLVLEGVLVVVCLCFVCGCVRGGTWVGYGVFAGCEIMVVMWELCFSFWW